MFKLTFISVFLFITYCYANNDSLSNRNVVTFIPPSRAFLCKTVNLNRCNTMAKDYPEKIKGPRGFPKQGPPDGQLASAGMAEYKELDENNDQQWKFVEIIFFPSGPEKFVTKIKWKSYIVEESTKSKLFWPIGPVDEKKPLSRDMFYHQPMCTKDFGGSKPNDKDLEYDCFIEKKYIEQVRDKKAVFYFVLDGMGTESYYQIVDGIVKVDDTI